MQPADFHANGTGQLSGTDPWGQIPPTRYEEAITKDKSRGVVLSRSGGYHPSTKESEKAGRSWREFVIITEPAATQPDGHLQECVSDDALVWLKCNEAHTKDKSVLSAEPPTLPPTQMYIFKSIRWV